MSPSAPTARCIKAVVSPASGAGTSPDSSGTAPPGARRLRETWETTAASPADAAAPSQNVLGEEQAARPPVGFLRTTELAGKPGRGRPADGGGVDGVRPVPERGPEPAAPGLGAYGQYARIEGDLAEERPPEARCQAEIMDEARRLRRGT